MSDFTIGVDFGTQSVRAIVVRAVMALPFLKAPLPIHTAY